MALPVYYPEYHGYAYTVDPRYVARQPAMLVQTRHVAANAQVFSLPAWFAPHIKRKEAGRFSAGRVPLRQNVNGIRPQANPPFTGAAGVATRMGRLSAPSGADTSGSINLCSHS